MSAHPEENAPGPQNGDPKKRRGVSPLLLLLLLFVGLVALVHQFRIMLYSISEASKAPVAKEPQTVPQKAYRLMQNGVFTTDKNVSRESFKQVIELYGDETDELSRYSVAVSRVNLTNYIEDAAEKKRLLDPVIAEFKETVDIHSRLAYHVARAMNIRAALFDALDDQKSMYREVIDRYDKSGFPLMFPQIVRAYCELARLTSDPVEKMRLFDAGITAYDPVGDGDLQYWVARCMNHKVEALGDPAEQLAVLDDLLNKFVNSQYHYTQTQVVWAMAKWVEITEDSAMKLAALDAIVRKFGESEDEYVVKRVEWARRQIVKMLQSHFGGGKLAGLYAFPPDRHAAMRALTALRKEAKDAKTPSEKLAVYDRILETFGKDGTKEIQYHIVETIMDKARLVTDVPEKIALYDMVIDKGLGSDGLLGTRPFFKAVGEKAELLSDNAEKIALYDHALAKIRDYPHRFSMMEVETLLDKKVELQGDASAKTAFFDAIIQDNRNAGAVANALMAKARGNFGNRENLRLYEEIVTRFKDSDDPAVLGTLGTAYQSLALFSKDPAEKNRLYDEMIAKFSALDGTNPRLSYIRRYAPEAMLAKAQNTKDKNERIRLYDKIVDKYKNDDTGLAGFASQALEAKVRLTSDVADAVRVFDEIAAGGKKDHLVAQTLYAKTKILEDNAEKIRVFDEIVSKFGESDEHRIQYVVAKARFGKAEAVEDKDEKRKLFREYIDRYAESSGKFPYVGHIDDAYEALVKLATDKEEKLRLYDEQIAMYGNKESRPRWRGTLLVKVLLEKAKEQDDISEKMRIYDRIIEDKDLAEGKLTQSYIVEAMLGKAEALPDKADKIAAYDAILARFGDENDFVMGSDIQKAIVAKALLLDDHSVISDYYDGKISGLTNVKEIAKWTQQKGFALSRYAMAKQR